MEGGGGQFISVARAIYSCLSEGHKQQMLRRECLLDELAEGKRLQSMCSVASNVWYCMILQACVSHGELSIIHSQRSTHLHYRDTRLDSRFFTFFQIVSSNQKY